MPVCTRLTRRQIHCNIVTQSRGSRFPDLRVQVGSTGFHCPCRTQYYLFYFSGLHTQSGLLSRRAASTARTNVPAGMQVQPGLMF